MIWVVNIVCVISTMYIAKAAVKPVQNEDDSNKLKVAKTKYQASPEEYKNNNRQLNDTKPPTSPQSKNGVCFFLFYLYRQKLQLMKWQIKCTAIYQMVLICLYTLI